MSPNLKMSPQAAAEFLSGAIRSDNLDALHRLLFEDRADPDSLHDGATMLHLAAKLERDRALSMLLEAGADVHKADAQGKSVLRAAIKVGNGISVKKLLEAGADPTATAEEQDIGHVVSDSEIAHRYGHEVASPVLGAVDKFNVNKAVRDKDAVWLENLLKRGQPPDTFDRFGKTALIEAIENGFAEGVEILLRYKADPNLAAKKSGLTPMHFAAAGDKPEFVEMLFTAGAKVNAKDASDVTPLETAVQKGNRPVIDAVRKYLLLEEMNFASAISRLSAPVEAPQKASFRKPKPLAR